MANYGALLFNDMPYNVRKLLSNWFGDRYFQPKSRRVAIGVIIS
jgi:hypothetical protein